MNPQTVAETVASNIRAYRQLRRLEQEALAQRMRSIGIPWRRATVSEVERNQRSVSVTELLGLAVALDATVEQFVDTRGPASRVGPSLVLTDQSDQRDAIAFHASAVNVLLCTHTAYADVEWAGNDFQNIVIKGGEGSAS